MMLIQKDSLPAGLIQAGAAFLQGQRQAREQQEQKNEGLAHEVIGAVSQGYQQARQAHADEMAQRQQQLQNLQQMQGMLDTSTPEGKSQWEANQQQILDHQYALANTSPPDPTAFFSEHLGQFRGTPLGKHLAPYLLATQMLGQQRQQQGTAPPSAAPGQPTAPPQAPAATAVAPSPAAASPAPAPAGSPAANPAAVGAAAPTPARQAPIPAGTAPAPPIPSGAPAVNRAATAAPGYEPRTPPPAQPASAAVPAAAPQMGIGAAMQALGQSLGSPELPAPTLAAPTPAPSSPAPAAGPTTAASGATAAAAAATAPPAIPDPVIPASQGSKLTYGGKPVTLRAPIADADRGQYDQLRRTLIEAAGRDDTTPEQKEAYRKYATAAVKAAQSGIPYQQFEDANPSLGLMGTSLVGPKVDPRESRLVETNVKGLYDSLQRQPLTKEGDAAWQEWLKNNPPPTSYKTSEDLRNARQWFTNAGNELASQRAIGNLKQRSEDITTAQKQALTHNAGWNAVVSPNEKNPEAPDEALPTLLPSLLAMEKDPKNKGMILPFLGFHEQDVNDIQALMDKAKTETDPAKAVEDRQQALTLSVNLRDRLRARLTAKQESDALSKTYREVAGLSPQLQANPEAVLRVYTQNRIPYLAPKDGQPSYRSEQAYQRALRDDLPKLGGKDPKVQRAVIENILGLGAAAGHTNIPLNATDILGLPEDVRQKLAQGQARIKIAGEVQDVRKLNGVMQRDLMKARINEIQKKAQGGAATGSMTAQQKGQLSVMLKNVGDLRKQIDAENKALLDPTQQSPARQQPHQDRLKDLNTQLTRLESGVNSLVGLGANGLPAQGAPQGNAQPQAGRDNFGSPTAPGANPGAAPGKGGRIGQLAGWTPAAESAFQKQLSAIKAQRPGVVIPDNVRQQMMQDALAATQQRR